jgi:hypothetical protein
MALPFFIESDFGRETTAQLRYDRNAAVHHDALLMQHI